MSAVLVVSLPAVVCLLIVLAGVEAIGVLVFGRKRLWWMRKRSGLPVTSAAFDDFGAFLYGTRQYEIDRRASELVLRDEDTDGAPPRSHVDLDAGIAKLVMDDKD